MVLNLKALVKVSKVSWTSQLSYELLRSSFDRKFDNTNFVSPKKTPPKSSQGCCYFLPFHFHSILVFPKLKIAISFHFDRYFLPLLNLSKNEEWKEIAILELLFPSTFFLILIIAISFHFYCYFLPFRNVRSGRK